MKENNKVAENTREEQKNLKNTADFLENGPTIFIKFQHLLQTIPLHYTA
jgi:hypothetical protein